MRQLQTTLNRFLGGGRPPRQPDLQAKPRRAFVRLAAQRGLSWSKTRDGYLEVEKCAAFPEGLVTAFHGWDDALSRVEHCLAHPEAAATGEFVE